MRSTKLGLSGVKVSIGYSVGTIIVDDVEKTTGPDFFTYFSFLPSDVGLAVIAIHTHEPWRTVVVVDGGNCCCW